MRRALYFLIPAAFLLVIIAPGCYTMIAHPSDEGGYYVEQTTDCNECHFSFDEYPYGYYYSPYPDYWWDHADYVYYYAYPWWWDHYSSPGMADRDSRFGRRELEEEPGSPAVIYDPYDPTIIIVPGSPNYPSPQDPAPPPGRIRLPNDNVDDGGSRQKGEQKDEPAGKESTPTRPKPKKEGDAGQNNTSTNTPPPEKPEESNPPKKSRQGGRGQ